MFIPVGQMTHTREKIDGLEDSRLNAGVRMALGDDEADVHVQLTISPRVPNFTLDDDGIVSS